MIARWSRPRFWNKIDQGSNPGRRTCFYVCWRALLISCWLCSSTAQVSIFVSGPGTTRLLNVHPDCVLAVFPADSPLPAASRLEWLTTCGERRGGSVLPLYFCEFWWSVARDLRSSRVRHVLPRGVWCCSRTVFLSLDGNPCGRARRRCEAAAIHRVHSLIFGQTLSATSVSEADPALAPDATAASRSTNSHFGPFCSPHAPPLP